jgi:isoleucyl-tRNA synthetase
MICPAAPPPTIGRCSYPFCWRSDTPLIQLACPAWFVSVEPLKDRLLANNKVGT